MSRSDLAKDLCAIGDRGGQGWSRCWLKALKRAGRLPELYRDRGGLKGLTQRFGLEHRGDGPASETLVPDRRATDRSKPRAT